MRRTSKITEKTDLMHLDHRQILEESRLKNRISNETLAKMMAMGAETIARYQRVPNEGETDYGLPHYRVHLWNEKVGNDMLIQWLCQLCGGVFVRVDGDSPADMNIAAQMGRVNKEAHEAISEFLKAMEDGEFQDGDRPSVVKELKDLVIVAQTALRAAEGRPTRGKG